MKFILGCCFILLLLSVLIPKATEAKDPDPKIRKQLVQLVLKHGWKLAKMAYYAKCPTVGVPRGIKCPKYVFGVGLSANLAKTTAEIYTKMFAGNKQCVKYIGDCSSFQFTKALGM